MDESLLELRRRRRRRRWGDLEGIWWVLIGFGGGEGVVIDQRRRRVMSGRERDATKKVGMDHARAGLGVCVCVWTRRMGRGVCCFLWHCSLGQLPPLTTWYTFASSSVVLPPSHKKRIYNQM